MLLKVASTCYLIVAVYFGLGCSSTNETDPATTSTPAQAAATRTPTTPTPGPSGGAIVGATPSNNYVALPVTSITPTVFPPGTLRGAPATSFTPEPRRSGGGQAGGTPPAMGAIEGQLIYPSEGIPPDLIVCAESLDWGETYCTNQRVDRPRHPGGLQGGYLLQLPAGRYLVFSMVPPGLKRAYYSYFVPCGLHVNCPSHDPIIVEVRPGQLLTDVNPGDWYVPPP